jgi:hypothetical protein
LRTRWGVPRICEFHGIAISMYYRDHAPPHFHATHGGDKAAFEIDPVRLAAGRLPAHATKLVLQWASMHVTELRDNWQRTQNRQPPLPIAPLP